MNKLKKVLFVGSFKNQSKDGSVGGQMFACNTLIESDISNYIHWIKIDSTADSNIISPVFKRAFKAIKRLFTFTFYLLTKKIDVVLIFTADGLSFIEKGLMIILAKTISKETILAPRSGIIVDDIKKSAFMRFYIPLVLSKCDKVICQSEVWMKFFSKIYDGKKNQYIIIHNWIDVLKYSNDTIPYKLNGQINILFMSWVDRNKGVFDLIEAANLLNDKYSNLIYHIAGGGSAMIECRLLVKEYHLESRFIFHDWVTGASKTDLIKSADIYILPSYYEGYPNSLMEAMVSAKACIATKVGSIPDMIIDEKNGLLFNAGDVSQLANKLEQLITNSEYRLRVGEEARKTTLDRNSVESAVERFKKILIKECAE